jgi:hypothetical protein
MKKERYDRVSKEFFEKGKLEERERDIKLINEAINKVPKDSQTRAVLDVLKQEIGGMK